MKQIYSNTVASALSLVGTTYATETEIGRVPIEFAGNGQRPRAIAIRCKGTGLAGGSFARIRAYFVAEGVLHTAAFLAAPIFEPNDTAPSPYMNCGVGVATFDLFALVAPGGQLEFTPPGDELVVTLEDDRTAGTLDAIEVLYYGEG